MTQSTCTFLLPDWTVGTLIQPRVQPSRAEPCSQCSTLVRNTVVRAIHTVNGRLGNSTPRGSKTPEPIEMKLYMVDYVTHPTPHAQFG